MTDPSVAFIHKFFHFHHGDEKSMDAHAALPDIQEICQPANASRNAEAKNGRDKDMQPIW